MKLSVRECEQVLSIKLSVISLLVVIMLVCLLLV